MKSDPIVTDVRRVRQQHAESLGYDLSRIFDDLKQSEQSRDRERSPLLAPLDTAVPAAGPSVRQARYGSLKGEIV
jgi:hypothetical protein